jgi:hypothetical protein
MTWRDAIAVAARSVRRRAGRAVLTVLAIALAATLLTSLLIASGAARRRVLDQVSEGGPLAGIEVAAAAPNPGALDSDQPAPGAPRAIDDAALRRIAAVPNVKSVVPVVATPVVVVPPATVVTTPSTGSGTTADTTPSSFGPRRPGGQAAEGDPVPDTLIGVDTAHAQDLPISVIAGRMPDPGSLTEVAVTRDFARRVGLDDAHAKSLIGSEVTIGAPRAFDIGRDQRYRGRWTRQEIVGVVAQEAAAGDVVAPIEQARLARAWTEASVQPAAFTVDPSPYSLLFVVAKGLDHVTDVRVAINRIGYSTSAPETLIAQVQRYLRVVEIVLGGIGFIALFIAALGITNAMLAAVRERRREIGVLKAIGARDRDVRRVFLLEAGTLGFVGGAIGALLGYALARSLSSVVNRYLSEQHLAGVSLGMPVALLAAAIGGATLLALVAGTIPAQRAARLPARQAMGDR